MARPGVTCPTSIRYDIDKEKLNSQLGPLSVWSLRVLPVFAWVFSGDSGFLPHPKDVHVGELACLNCLECGCVRVDQRWSSSCPEWVPPCALSCQERLQLPGSLKGNK